MQKDTKSDIWHANLDVAGMIFDFADLVNMAAYALEGDYGNAALSGMGSLSTVGGLATGAKYADDVVDAAKAADNASDASKAATKSTKTYNWGNINTLDDHFVRHGSDVGATTFTR